VSINKPQISCSRAGVQLSTSLVIRNALTGTEAKEEPDMQKVEQKSNK